MNKKQEKGVMSVEIDSFINSVLMKFSENEFQNSDNPVLRPILLYSSIFLLGFFASESTRFYWIGSLACGVGWTRGALQALL
ncbi:hypothetical protein SDJN02_02845, partial [Cucurbita argyrosperma subsp. argyrosperma]